VPDTIVYDIEIGNTIEEIGGWYHDKMKFGSAVAYSMNLDRYFFFLHESKKQDLINLLNGNRVVTFGGIKFDSKVMLGSNRKVEKVPGGIGLKVSNVDDTVQWLEFDIYLQVVRSQYNLTETFDVINKFGKSGKGNLKLGSIASNTLGSNFDKTDSGENAPIMYKRGEFSELLEYNLQDTALTKKLYDFIIQNKFVKDGRGVKIDINLNNGGIN
jgi:hypothetical protein